jgi:hypothetical protein
MRNKVHTPQCKFNPTAVVTTTLKWSLTPLENVETNCACEGSPVALRAEVATAAIATIWYQNCDRFNRNNMFTKKGNPR